MKNRHLCIVIEISSHFRLKPKPGRSHYNEDPWCLTQCSSRVSRFFSFFTAYKNIITCNPLLAAHSSMSLNYWAPNNVNFNVFNIQRMKVENKKRFRFSTCYFRRSIRLNFGVSLRFLTYIYNPPHLIPFITPFGNYGVIFPILSHLDATTVDSSRCRSHAINSPYLSDDNLSTLTN